LFFLRRNINRPALIRLRGGSGFLGIILRRRPFSLALFGDGN
jgi:hypothetical protein